MSDPFIAEIVMFGGNFAPRGWAFCDGQLLPISQNEALFSILGTTYGGDGRTSFGLPDLRGRSPKHPGNGPGLRAVRLGERGGREEHTLTVSEMPSHDHPHRHSNIATTMDATHRGGKGRVLAKPPAGTSIYAQLGTAITMADESISSATPSNTGGGQGFSILNPYTGVNFIIALQGGYPPRS